MKPGGATRGSFYMADDIATHPIKVHRPLKGCKCVWYVAESKGPAKFHGKEVPLPRDIRELPFEVTSLCKGGKVLTGRRAFDTLEKAQADARDRAKRDRARCR